MNQVHFINSKPLVFVTFGKELEKAINAGWLTRASTSEPSLIGFASISPNLKDEADFDLLIISWPNALLIKNEDTRQITKILNGVFIVLIFKMIVCFYNNKTNMCRKVNLAQLSKLQLSLSSEQYE